MAFWQDENRIFDFDNVLYMKDIHDGDDYLEINFAKDEFITIDYPEATPVKEAYQAYLKEKYEFNKLLGSAQLANLLSKITREQLEHTMAKFEEDIRGKD